MPFFDPITGISAPENMEEFRKMLAELKKEDGPDKLPIREINLDNLKDENGKVVIRGPELTDLCNAIRENPAKSKKNKISFIHLGLAQLQYESAKIANGLLIQVAKEQPSLLEVDTSTSGFPRKAELKAVLQPRVDALKVISNQTEFDQLLKALNLGIEIKQINLDNFNINSTQLEQLTEALKKQKTVEKINFGPVDLSMRGGTQTLKNFTAMVKSNTSIKFIDMNTISAPRDPRSIRTFSKAKKEFDDHIKSMVAALSAANVAPAEQPVPEQPNATPDAPAVEATEPKIPIIKPVVQPKHDVVAPPEQQAAHPVDTSLSQEPVRSEPTTVVPETFASKLKQVSQNLNDIEDEKKRRAAESQPPAQESVRRAFEQMATDLRELAASRTRSFSTPGKKPEIKFLQEAIDVLSNHKTGIFEKTLKNSIASKLPIYGSYKNSQYQADIKLINNVVLSLESIRNKVATGNQTEIDGLNEVIKELSEATKKANGTSSRNYLKGYLETMEGERTLQLQSQKEVQRQPIKPPRSR